FAGEAVECPEQHAIELALMGILEQPGELLAALGVLPAGFMVDVFVHDGVAGGVAPGQAGSGRVDPDGGAGERHGALGRWRAKVSFDRTAMLAKWPRAPPSRWRRWRAALGALAFRFCAVSFSRR